MLDTLKDKLLSLQKTAKERTVKTQNIEYDLETLAKKVKKNYIKLDPEYQRKHRWTDETSSKLIESLILNIPIPTVYLSQDIDVDEEIDDEIARYSVIDGQQRLTAICEFMENNYALKGMEVLEELNGSFYKDLPPFLIRRLEERTIKCLRIDSTVDEQVKYDIFERLNTGSVQLESQELRNAVYRGPFNNLIKELAKDANFRILVGITENNPEENNKVKKMQDVELVLRFFSLDNDNFYALRKGFKKFLSDEMERLNKLDNEALEILGEHFRNVMRTILEYFGELAFAKYRFESGCYSKMSNFNVAVYDALSVAVSTSIKSKGTDFIGYKVEEYQKLFSDPIFFEALSGSVNDREKVIKRIEAVIGVLS